MDGTDGMDRSSTWPTTTDGRWRLRWHTPHTRQGEDRLSVVVNDIRDDPPRADIWVVAEGETVADYRDLRTGDTVEIAGQLWEVTAVDPGAMDAGQGDPDFRAGHVDLHRTGTA